MQVRGVAGEGEMWSRRDAGEGRVQGTGRHPRDREAERGREARQGDNGFGEMIEKLEAKGKTSGREDEKTQGK